MEYGYIIILGILSIICVFNDEFVAAMLCFVVAGLSAINNNLGWMSGDFIKMFHKIEKIKRKK